MEVLKCRVHTRVSVRCSSEEVHDLEAWVSAGHQKLLAVQLENKR